MSKTQTNIGNAVLKSLVEMKEKNSGSLNIEDVGAMFESMSSSLQQNNPTDILIRSEISKISDYITNARQEIGTIHKKDSDGNDSIGQAGAELSEVVRATEEATNTILDAADIIMEKTNTISDKKIADSINKAIEEIYSATSFQDITGQRISKVISTIEFIEYKLEKLRNLVGDGDCSPISEDEEKFKDNREDADLCNGPQMSKEAPSQDDIDALFDSI